MPLVSVIIPAYNSENYIGACLESVLNQTLDDIEIIVVDDGSTDSTLSIAKEFEQRDGRLTVLSQNNQFAGVARNNGMKQAAGEYLYFLDSDDFIDKTALSSMSQAALAHGADVVVCRSRSLSMSDGHTEPITYALRGFPFNAPLSRDVIAKSLFSSVVGWPWDKLFRRDFIFEHDLSYQALRSTNDAFFVFIAMALADTTYCLDKELVTHRVDDLSSISNTRRKSWNNSLIAMGAIRDRLESEGLYSQFAKTFTNWCVNFTRWNIDTLDDQSAIKLIAEARPILKGVPLDEDYYQLPEDFEFAKLIQLNHDESTLFATRQIKECIAARRLYSMGFFKLLLKLKAPYRFVRDRILANRHV